MVSGVQIAPARDCEPIAGHELARRRPLKSKVEALDDPRHGTPDLLPPPGTMDQSSVATATGSGPVREIKEWQAVMDYLRALPVKNGSQLPTIPVDERAAEVRAIKVG